MCTLERDGTPAVIRLGAKRTTNDSPFAIFAIPCERVGCEPLIVAVR